VEDSIQIDDSVVKVNDEGTTTMLITNRGRSACVLQKGMELAHAWEADVLGCTDSTKLTSDIFQDDEEGDGMLKLFNVKLSSGDTIYSNERVKWRQEQLQNLMIGIEERHSQGECSQLSGLLAQYHDIFSLEDNDRGETDLVEFKIDTHDSCPRKLPV